MRQLLHGKTRLTGAFKVSVTGLLLVAASFFSRAQNAEVRDYRVGVSTNLPYDITWLPSYGVTSIPSLSLEFYPKAGHWTYGLDAEWPMWRHEDTHRFLQVNNLSAWTRRYFALPDEGRYRKWYLSGSFTAARYGIGFNTGRGWQGEGLGLSLGGGHKWTLGKHFTVDLGLALGVFYTGYDPYVWGNDATGWYYYDYDGDPAAFRKRNQRFIWAGPTRIYINIGFDFWSRSRAGRTEEE